MKNTNLQPTGRSFDQLQRSINAVDYFIRRDYLADLSSCEVMELPPQDTKLIRLFHVDKLIFDNDENINDKLVSIYSAIQNVGATSILLIKGTAKDISFYIGVRADESVVICADILENSFKANFPGSELHHYDDTEIQQILSDQCFDNICSVTAVPSMRDEDKEKGQFVQGLEKLIDTMRGHEYSALFISKPISKQLLNQRRLGLERLYSSLSPYAKTTLAYGENQSEAVAKGTFANFSSTLNESISNTLGENWSSTTGTSKTYDGFFASTSRSKSDTYGFSASETTTKGSATTTGSGTNESRTDTYGSSKTCTFAQNSPFTGTAHTLHTENGAGKMEYLPMKDDNGNRQFCKMDDGAAIYEIDRATGKERLVAIRDDEIWKKVRYD